MNTVKKDSAEALKKPTHGKESLNTLMSLVGVLAIVNDGAQLLNTDKGERAIRKLQAEIFELARTAIFANDKKQVAAYLEILAEANLRVLETMERFSKRCLFLGDVTCIERVAEALENFKAIDWGEADE